MWQSHSPSQPSKTLVFAQFLRNLLCTGKSKGKCHWATNPVPQWKRHQRKQVHGTCFETPKLNEKAKCHRSLGCLYISGPGQCLFEDICQGFPVDLSSQAPMDAIHSSQHRLVLNITGSWGACLHPILSWSGWVPQGLRGEEKASSAAVSALCQKNKTLDYAHVYKVKWLTSTSMRHLHVSQSLAICCLLWIRENFGQA